MRVVSKLFGGRLLPVLVVLALVAGVVLGGRSLFSAETTRATLEFDQTKGLYKGDDVTILGVTVGQVVDVRPGTDSVEVEIEVKGHRLPADVRAVLVAPSLVSVRRIEMSPVYTKGPELRDGATVPESRTAIPVEWDDVKKQLVRLTDALGTQGANKDGSLNRLLDVSARNLKGNGADVGSTITSLSKAMETLSAGRGDLFATVRNLQVFTEALEQSDGQVAEFNSRLADVSDLLADDRKKLSAALDGLETAFPKVQTFLQTNGDELTATVSELQAPVQLLADNRQKLADILQVAPGTLSNFYNIIDPDIPALTGAFALTNFQAPSIFICSALYSLGGTPEDCQKTLEPIVKMLKVDSLPVGVAPLIRDGRKNVDPSPASGADLLGQMGTLSGGDQ